MKVEKGNLSHGSENLGKSECHEIFLLMKMRDGCISTASEIGSEAAHSPERKLFAGGEVHTKWLVLGRLAGRAEARLTEVRQSLLKMASWSLTPGMCAYFRGGRVCASAMAENLGCDSH